MPVQQPGKALSRALPQIVRCRDAFNGTDAIKAKKERYLPALPSHREGRAGTAAYESYIRRALFLNATGRAIHGLAGLVLQKDSQVTMPDQAEDDRQDITLAGEDLEQFIANTLIEDLITGGYGILVDMAPEGGRPYWSLYKREQIISFEVTRIDGEEGFTSVVLREHYEVKKDDDEFDTELRVQYRHLYLTGEKSAEGSGIYQQQLYRQPVGSTRKSKDFEKYEAPVTPRRGKEPLTFIPFVKPDEKKPPLVDMVDVNLQHYMVSADFNYGLHIIALPTPYVVGYVDTPGQEGNPVPLGPGACLKLKDGGEAKYMEFSGQGMEAVSGYMDELVTQMAMIGARLIEENPKVAETATAVIARSSGEHSSLRAETGFVEADLTRALRVHGWWVNPMIEKPNDIEDVWVRLNRDYLAIKINPQLLQQLLMALLAGKISFETWWRELQQGDVGRPGATSEDELEEIAEDVMHDPLSGLNPEEG